MLAASLLIAVVKKKRKKRKDSEQHGLNHGQLLLTRRNKLGVDNTFLQEFHLELVDEYKCFL